MPFENSIDLNEMREALGTIMASFVYIYDTFAITKEIDITMSYEAAMLEKMEVWGVKKFDNYYIKKPTEGFKVVMAEADNPQQEDVDKLLKIGYIKVESYRDYFFMVRQWWVFGLNAYNQNTGSWKDTIIICSALRERLMIIALRENLVALSSQMLRLGLPQAPPPAPAEDQRFASEGR